MKILSLFYISMFLAACDFQYALPNNSMTSSDMTTQCMPSNSGSTSDTSGSSVAAIEFSNCNAEISSDNPNSFNLKLPLFSRSPGKQFLCTIVHSRSFTNSRDLNVNNNISMEIDYKSKTYESHVNINNTQEYGLYNEEFVIKIFGDGTDEYTLGSISGHNLSSDNESRHLKAEFKLPKHFSSSPMNHTIKGISIFVISHYAESGNFKTATNASLFPDVFFKEPTTFAIKNISIYP